MARADFDQQLNGLEREIGMLAEIVVRAVQRAIDALKSRDLDASQRVVHEDGFVDQKRLEIEDRCVDLIAAQQPMGIDLRVIISLLHIVNELERMGDYSESITNISLMMGDEPTLKPLVDIPRMTELATRMLRDSIDSLAPWRPGTLTRPTGSGRTTMRLTSSTARCTGNCSCT